MYIYAAFTRLLNPAGLALPRSRKHHSTTILTLLSVSLCELFITPWEPDSSTQPGATPL